MTDYTNKKNQEQPKKAEAQTEKKIEKVVSSEVITRKQPLGKKIKAIFFGGTITGAMKYIAADVLLPAARDLMVDATNKGVSRVVYGDTPPRRSNGRPTNYGPRVQYSSPVRREPMRRDDFTMLPGQPPRYNTPVKPADNEYIVSSRGEAEQVLERLGDIVEQYEVASRGDLNELLGLPSSHVDQKWGWTYLTSASIMQIREGYLLVLPPSEPI